MTAASSPSNRRRRRIATLAILVLLSAGLLTLASQSNNAELKSNARWLFAIWLATGLIALSLSAVDYLSTIILAQVMTAIFCLVTADYVDPDWNTLLGCTCVGTLVGMPVGVGYAAYRWLNRTPAT